MKEKKECGGDLEPLCSFQRGGNGVASHGARRNFAANSSASGTPPHTTPSWKALSMSSCRHTSVMARKPTAVPTESCSRSSPFMNTLTLTRRLEASVTAKTHLLPGSPSDLRVYATMGCREGGRQARARGVKVGEGGKWQQLRDTLRTPATSPCAYLHRTNNAGNVHARANSQPRQLVQANNVPRGRQRRRAP